MTKEQERSHRLTNTSLKGRVNLCVPYEFSIFNYSSILNIAILVMHVDALQYRLESIFKMKYGVNYAATGSTEWLAVSRSVESYA